MIRASLSDRRSNVRSCCRWLTNGSGGDRRPKRRLPITSSNKSHYHSLSRSDVPFSANGKLLYHQRPSPLLSTTENVRHRTASSSMSTKPSYGFLEDDGDDGVDTDGDHKLGNGEDDSEHQLRWIKRSSGLDSFSDNFNQTESLAENSKEESLLHLLSNNNNTSINRTRARVAHTKQTDDKFAEDASLHQLLNRDVEDSKSSSQFSYQSDSEAHLQHQKNETEGSLMGLLNGFTNESSSSSTEPIQLHHQKIADEAESLYEILNQETKDTAKDTKYKDLNRLQMQLEVESTEEAIRKHLDVWNSARDRSDYETIPAVRRAIDSWYGPLTEAIELEQWLYLNNDLKTCAYGLSVEGQDDASSNPDSDDSQDGNSSSPQRSVKDRRVYGPLLCLLPARKIAVLLSHTALSLAMTHKGEESKVVSLAMYIANALEMEVNVSRALRVRANERRLELKCSMKEMGGDDSNLSDAGGIQGETLGDEIETPGNEGATDNHSEGFAIDSWIYTATHLQRFMDELSTKNSRDQKSLKGQGNVRPTLVRKRCKEILLAEGFVSDWTSESEANKKMSMNNFAEWDPVKKVKLGAALIRMLLDQTAFSKPLKDGGHAPPEPAFRYLRKGAKGGKNPGYIEIHPDLMNIAVEEEFSSSSTFIPPSMSNTRVQPMVVPPKEWTGVNNGGYEIIKVPFMRTRHCKTQKDSIHRADLSKVMEGLNVLGKIPWKINQKVLDAALKCWDDGIILGDIPSQVNFEVPPLPEALEYQDYKTLGDFEKKVQLDAYLKYKDKLSKHNRFKQKNMDLHSLRCSAMLKLNQAKKFRDFEEVFFPYNVDFRGRAYPVPPHLSIVGSDLCRALLMFAHSKPLGKNGLYWLKVHLANLAGADKMSFDGRAQFADDNMDNIRAAVNESFGGNDWWKKFDDPFQGLATCHEIVQAIDSGDPENYMCSLPVHMDGSCNGLQHYAALGRDRGGGKAVNLCVADKPQDVYIGVMHEVVRRVALDAEEMIPFDENKSDLTGGEKDLMKKIKSARLVSGLIDRGVVKRTVMTSVYGVTYIGAKNQISEKIEEKLEENGHDVDEIEQEIHTACGYLASMTMEVMGQQFKGARQTMSWLTECARLIASQGQPVSFVSPIGVPVVQPYRQRRPFTVVTLLQNITLTNDSDILPLHRQRQVSAFPPNYVHSLDSSHMLLTAIEMDKRGLSFSAVHDSYWTHPCDIEEMNVVLRESFIDLYKRPLLEELKKMWEIRYPSITFPDVPARGDLDLNDVRSAPYFFQ
mmetsp:Transcript_21755/g.47275  ORF Transcript_21755/g.47275 Transcript_21755/m.47275 type:complete len:1265 (+) Transcript_21755:177-3971(+)|eukprot:CAMPEP_0172325022 /NCGR_PEP_ID=MMETSP1058-20130122/52872_1 /TAXON_ID=83371 /ORGANISM="Detonula confervacea, Strain CCMP 353" /LENGTH=1264 /DNA_ID=CAMNT_0013041457 /DNA_START=127 /DNA_END=3921 /DNA_ORIENTATION=+